VSDAIRVNNNQVSWGDIVLKVAEERYTGFTSIVFADRRTRVKGYGLTKHHAPYGRSRGKYEIDPVKLVGWKESVAALRAGLAARAPDGISYGDVEFQIVVQYIDDGMPPLTVLLQRCVWMSNSTADEESPDSLKEEIEIDCMWISRNDYVLFDARGGQP
jgi:hypothetical protein